jgi:hypothetical protein
LGIISESVRLYEGRFNKRVAISTIITNILVLGATAIVFLNGNIINPEFITFVNEVFSGSDNEFALAAATHINSIIFGVIGLILLIEIVYTAIKIIRIRVN